MFFDLKTCFFRFNDYRNLLKYRWKMSFESNEINNEILAKNHKMNSIVGNSYDLYFICLY